MEVALNKQGEATIHVSFWDWVKAATMLVACLWGHARLQCAKIDAVAQSLQVVSDRMTITETKLSTVVNDQVELKHDYKETTKELRYELRELNQYLRNSRAATAEAVH